MNNNNNNCYQYRDVKQNLSHCLQMTNYCAASHLHAVGVCAHARGAERNQSSSYKVVGCASFSEAINDSCFVYICTLVSFCVAAPTIQPFHCCLSVTPETLLQETETETLVIVKSKRHHC